MSSLNVAPTLQTSHKDGERKNVGHTALAVALLRSLEHKSPNSIIYDPFAEHLASEGAEFFLEFLKNKAPNAIEKYCFGLAVRTRKIDEELLKSFREGIDQVVVIGAGLDSRAWRLGKCNYTLPGDEQLFRNVSWFEIDFPEVLEYKLNALKKFSTICKTYVPVTADLSLPSWTDKFLKTTYDPKKRTVWLLEGLTTYLTEEELSLLITRLTSISLNESIFIATFSGPEKTLITTSMHRFFTKTPEEFMKKFGWEGTANDLPTIGKEYNRYCEDNPWFISRLLVAKKKSQHLDENKSKL